MYVDTVFALCKASRNNSSVFDQYSQLVKCDKVSETMLILSNLY